MDYGQSLQATMQVPVGNSTTSLRETALRELHTQFANANNQLTNVLDNIQGKINTLSKGEVANKEGSNEPCAPSRYSGMLYELECQKNIAQLNLSKAERILKEFSEII